MPEGPEVRRYADALHATLAGHRLTELTARTKAAKSWLADHRETLCGRRVMSVTSLGKNLVGEVEGGFYFYTHLMMWGSWRIEDVAPPERDRRERARIVMENGATAILLSAPVFEVGESGSPYHDIPYLAGLGPDILPPDGPNAFAASCFLERLGAEENRSRSIGAVLLDQTVAAGIGNYLRAEMLWECRIDPFRLVGELTEDELHCLCRVVPEMAARAYRTGGMTITDAEQARMQADRSLIYPNGSPEWGARHYVFRRSNLPCLACGAAIRQKRQFTRELADGTEKERIIYFCPQCQNVTVPLPPLRPTRAVAKENLVSEERDEETIEAAEVAAIEMGDE